MESISDYFHYYEPIPHIICAVAFFALMLFWSKHQEKQSAPKAKLVVIISLLFVVGQFLYFHFQHNTPHYLFHDYKDGARVDISEIVSVETVKNYRVYYIFHLTNGSTLKWRENCTDVHSRSGEYLRNISILDITDYK